MRGGEWCWGAQVEAQSGAVLLRTQISIARYGRASTYVTLTWPYAKITFRRDSLRADEARSMVDVCNQGSESRDPGTIVRIKVEDTEHASLFVLLLSALLF